jgi:hypothetical protein
MDLPNNEAFDRWCFTAVDERVKFEDGKPLPVLSVVLHRACLNDQRAFVEALRALQLAFEAGASAARNGND